MKNEVLAVQKYVFFAGHQSSKLGLSKCREKVHRDTMGLEGVVYLYHKMTPPPNFGHFWVIFEGWSQILP